MEIMAVSAPFLTVYAPNHDPSLRTIDLRAWGVTKLGPDYVKVWMNAAVRAEPKRPRKRKPKPDERDCQRCGLRLVQRWSNKSERWHYVCPECGFDKGPAEAVA